MFSRFTANTTHYVDALYPHTGILTLQNGIIQFQREFTLDTTVGPKGNGINETTTIRFVELSESIHVMDLLQFIHAMNDGRGAQCALGKHEYVMYYQGTFYFKTESSMLSMMLPTPESRRDVICALYDFYHWIQLLIQSRASSIPH